VPELLSKCFVSTLEPLQSALCRTQECGLDKDAFEAIMLKLIATAPIRKDDGKSKRRKADQEIG
jgi:hypothetical protein